MIINAIRCVKNFNKATMCAHLDKDSLECIFRLKSIRQSCSVKVLDDIPVHIITRQYKDTLDDLVRCIRKINMLDNL